MADNTTLNSGTGGDVIATDDVAGVKYQRVKLVDGTLDSTAAIPGDAANGLDVDVTRVSGNVTVVDGGGALSVDDNGGSLTVDGPLTDAQLRATSVPVDSELTTGDLDSGAGTDTKAIVGLAGSASGGGQIIPGDTTNGLDVDVTRVSGNVTVVDGGGSISVDDNAGSLTVDNGGTFAVQDSEKVADNAGFTDGTTKVQPVGYVFDEVAGTALTENDIAGARIDSKRAQVSVIEDETTRGRRATVTAANALKVDASAVAVPITDNAGSLTVDNAGTFAVQDSEKIADDAAFGVASTKLQPVGFLADQTSTDSVNEGDIGAARITLDRKLIVTQAPSADTEGLSIFRTLDADETEEDVKTSAGKLYGWFLSNNVASVVYVKFYNATAANTTVGSTTPILTIMLPASSSANVEFANGIAFSTALCIAATTGVGDADATAPAANQVVANVFYQ